MSYRTNYLGNERQQSMYKFLMKLYEDEMIAETNPTKRSTSENLLQVFLHTHQISVPVPITKFIKNSHWRETCMQEGGSGSLTLRMPWNIVDFLFKGEQLEPSTGHFISFRRVIPSENPFIDKIERKPMREYDGQSASEIIQDIQEGIVPTVEEITRAARIETEERRQFEANERQAQEEYVRRQERKRDKIFYQTFWIGQISNMSFGLAPNRGDGLLAMSDVNITLQSWDNLLKTTNYKIVNANIERARTDPDAEDGVEIREDATTMGSEGARFIITTDTFKKIVREVKDGITQEQDPKIGIKQILNIFGYHRLPGSLRGTNISIQRMMNELEKIEADKKSRRKRVDSPIGTSAEVTSDGANIRQLMITNGLTDLIDADGKEYTIEEAKQLTKDDFIRIFITEPREDEMNTVTAIGRLSISLAENIKVCTVKEDLPPSSGFLRHLLPNKVIHFKNLSRFTELLQQNGSPWTRIVGSFVSDGNIIELFPLIVPVTKDDLKSGWRPSGTVAIMAGYQLCLIWRIKPLRPQEIINRDFYNDWVEYANKNLRNWREFRKTEIDFAHDQLPEDEDAWSSVSSMGLDNRYIDFVNFNYSEAGRVNGAYLEHPFLRSESNLKFGTLSQPVIDTWGAQNYGFKMYEAQYPFLDATKDKVERDAMTEKVYCIMRDEGEGARGTFSMRGIHSMPLKPGIWVSFSFDSVFNPAQGMDSVINHWNANYYDKGQGEVTSLNFSQLFTCMVEAVIHTYDADPVSGAIVKTTQIQFSRGKFHGCPTLMPERHDFARPAATVADQAPPVEEEKDGSTQTARTQRRSQPADTNTDASTETVDDTTGGEDGVPEGAGDEVDVPMEGTDDVPDPGI